MMISIFEKRNGSGEGAGMPNKMTQLYEQAMTTMLERVNRKQRGGGASGGSSAIDVHSLLEMLQTVAFEAHMRQEREIEMHHLMIAAIRVSHDSSFDIEPLLRLKNPRERTKRLELECRKLPIDKRLCLQTIQDRVATDSLPLLSLLELEPLKFQFSHLSFQVCISVHCCLPRLCSRLRFECCSLSRSIWWSVQLT